MFNGICSKSLKPLYLQIREEKLQIIFQLRFQYDRRTGSQKKMEKEKKNKSINQKPNLFSRDLLLPIMSDLFEERFVLSQP